MAQDHSTLSMEENHRDEHNPSTPHNDEGHYPIPASNENSPVDLSFYQTPKQAFTSYRFLVNLLIGGIVGWVINYLIALFTTRNSERATLWRFVGDFNEEFSDGTSHFLHIYGSPIWIDFLFSGILTGFIGGFIGNFTLRWEIEHAKKRPILSENVEGRLVYRIWGATIGHMALRSLIMCVWGVLIAFPITLMGFGISCSSGGMRTMLLPPDFTVDECYLTIGWFCIIKGFYCAVITSLIGPLIEVGGLNTKNLTNKNLDRYFKRKAADREKDQINQSDQSEEPFQQGNHEQSD